MESLLQILLILTFSCCISSFSAADSYRKELRMKNDGNQEVIKQVDSSTLATKFDPSRVVQLSWRPRVFLYRGFLSDEECNHLISLAHEEKEKPSVKGVDSRKIAGGNQRATPVTPLEEQDDILARIEERIAAWTFLPKENGEPVQIMHYVSEDPVYHLDYYGDKAGTGASEVLMATVILYLSDVTDGGETLFYNSETENTQLNDDTWSDCARKGFAVKPVKGNALLFFSLHLNTSPDESSSTARCPVLQGEKWCAIKLFHLKQKISLEADLDECSDEEENCAEWASLGECDKNPLYMKGTPDYSGSCRKSCNVC